MGRHRHARFVKARQKRYGAPLRNQRRAHIRALRRVLVALAVAAAAVTALTVLL